MRASKAVKVALIPASIAAAVVAAYFAWREWFAPRFVATGDADYKVDAAATGDTLTAKGRAAGNVVSTAPTVTPPRPAGTVQT